LTGRLAANLTWITRRLTALPKSHPFNEGHDGGTLVIAAAWAVFTAWRFGPSCERPVLLELGKTAEGAFGSHKTLIHATHGPWNGTAIAVITGDGHTEPLWWPDDASNYYSHIVLPRSPERVTAAHDFHDTVTFALYHLLTPIRLSNEKRTWEDSSTGERAWRKEIIRRHSALAGCQDLLLEEHALEAGAASAGEVSFHYLHDRYHSHGGLEDFLRPPSSAPSRAREGNKGSEP